MIITIYHDGWKQVKGTCAFEMYGETFAAHKYQDSPDEKVRWTVSHVATGASVLPAGYKGRSLPTSRLGALTLAKSALEHRTAESVKAAIERAKGRLAEQIEQYGEPK
ncbi:MAG: hypothetical protein VW239_01520 [Candidatus Nanopelagicales bacterium]